MLDFNLLMPGGNKKFKACLRGINFNQKIIHVNKISSQDISELRDIKRKVHKRELGGYLLFI